MRNDVQGQAEKAAHDAVNAARELVDEWQALVTTTTAATASERVLRDFRNRFADLPALPERTHRELEARFDGLVRKYREILHSKVRDAERARLEQLREWDESVSSQEAAARAGEGEAIAMPDALFNPRLATLADEVPRDALRALAIRAELLAGVESPASERELRLQVQVDRLNAGMGNQHSAPDPLALAREWCIAGPKHEGCAELRERFFAALARAMED